MNLITPEGNKIRCQSQRRFILIADHSAPDKKPSASIVKRSDNLVTLRTVKARKGNWFGVDGSRRVLAIMDNVTGEVLS